MTLTTLTRRSGATDAAGPSAPADAPQDHIRRPAGPGSVRSTRDADALAVASFVLGLVGLLVMNILLGPAAIVMAVIALARSTARRRRALLGLALGIADLVILAFLVTGNGAVAWNFGG
ncbi:DUF4190 domain-containing protein [Streptomyces laculatispora]|uniref:DUF4190 domain-containing protein n=1 Tax=Streptomyces laculatispora TaxID=887464 RepID=A0ABY9I2F1_9ACTN|nr:DUF4190 domain-containing protein [Streptomyces laculatispora]WLQ40499.1 DUF4190 domain-containing protein [Streptomyces laculatispora]